MSSHHVPAAGVVPQAWRNGHGRTRELLAWPSPEHWLLRVSLADIDADAPFSPFPGVERWFAVVAGAGVALDFGDTTRHVVAGDAPLRFDGALAPLCRLLDGPTTDLNLMLRQGEGVMLPAQPGVAWPQAFAIRALFAHCGGSWSGHGESRRVAPRTLLWAEGVGDASDAWAFVADAPAASGPGWWLGYTPYRESA